jgi:hypothetical protein
MRKLSIAALIGIWGIAALAGGISLFPTVTEIILPLGMSYSDVLYITNTGDEPVTVEARVLGFMAPEGIPRFLEPQFDNYPFSGKDILTLEPAVQTIEPGDTAVFTYTLQMPEVLDPYGGRYVAAVFKVKPIASEAQVVVATQLASLFLINPGGEAMPHLQMGDLRVYQFKANPRKVILEAVVTNTGNLHISSDQIRGYVYITDADGYIVDEFPASTHTLLPGNSYLHQEVWYAPENLPSGTYQFHFALVLFGPAGTSPEYLFMSQEVELNF